MVKKKAAKGKKVRRNVPVGVAHISCGFNNTLITISDAAGNTIAWSSAGLKGFRGSKKSTPFAAQVAAEDVARKALDQGVASVSVKVSGPGSGRETAIRALQIAGLRVTAIRDITPMPHDGCQPPKRRRV